MAKSTSKKTVRQVVKSVPKVNKYDHSFDAKKWTGKLPGAANIDDAAIESETQGGANEVSEPAATYSRVSPRSKTAKPKKRKGYDAKKYTGRIPGIAERMKKYLKTMRNDR